jgi:methylmalonyl-CoA mutase cobalamin-binding domain/chain
VALDRGADAERDHRRAVLRAQAHDRGDLVGALREHDRVGRRDRVARDVGAVVVAHRGGGRDAVAEHRAQRVEQRRRERRVRARPQRGEVAGGLRLPRASFSSRPVDILGSLAASYQTTVCFGKPRPMPATLAPPAADDTACRWILDAAARFFAQKGFGDASMRDIAGAAGMLPGSLYYHFASKEDLLVAVYAEGVRRIKAAVAPALRRATIPGSARERVRRAPLTGLLEDSDYGQVVIRVRPDDAPEVAKRLTVLRDEYEQTFAQALSGLPLPPRTDRRALRLMLLGALNWSQTWYRTGKDSPQVLARRFVRLLREPLDADPMSPPPKVLITKIGLDGHDRGSRIVAAHLRDAGWRSSTRRRGRRSRVVKLALEEDVDVIGIVSLATDHLIVPKLMRALREAGSATSPVIVGGIVPDDDEKALLDAAWRASSIPARARRDLRLRARGDRARARRALPGLTRPA